MIIDDERTQCELCVSIHAILHAVKQSVRWLLDGVLSSQSSFYRHAQSHFNTCEVFVLQEEKTPPFCYMTNIQNLISSLSDNLVNALKNSGGHPVTQNTKKIHPCPQKPAW